MCLLWLPYCHPPPPTRLEHDALPCGQCRDDDGTAADVRELKLAAAPHAAQAHVPSVHATRQAAYHEA